MAQVSRRHSVDCRGPLDRCGRGRLHVFHVDSVVPSTRINESIRGGILGLRLLGAPLGVLGAPASLILLFGMMVFLGARRSLQGGPLKVDRTWTPRRVDLDRLELRLPRISGLSSTGDMPTVNGFHIQHPNQFYRQYVAVVQRPRSPTSKMVRG